MAEHKPLRILVITSRPLTDPDGNPITLLDVAEERGRITAALSSPLLTGERPGVRSSPLLAGDGPGVRSSPLLAGEGPGVRFLPEATAGAVQAASSREDVARIIAGLDGRVLNGKPIHVTDRAELGESVIGIGIPFKGKPGHPLFHAEMNRLTPIERQWSIAKVMRGRPPTGRSGLGCFSVRGRRRIPRPAPGINAVLIFGIFTGVTP